MNPRISEIQKVIIEIEYPPGGTDEKRAHSDGWVEFHNYENKSGDIWVHRRNMGCHSLADGKKYSFTI